MFEISTKSIRISFAILTSYLLIIATANAATLNQELTQLINKHPLVLAHNEKLLAADAEIEVAKDNYMPVLNITGDIGRQQYEDTGANTDSNLNNNRFTVSITQNLFKGFKDQAIENESISKQLSSKLTLDKTIQKLSYNASLTYSDVLHYQLLEKLIIKKVKLAEQFIQMREKQKKSGSGNQINVYEARLTKQRSLEQKLNIQGKNRSSLAKFKSIFDHAANSRNMFKPQSINNILPITLTQAIEVAKQNSFNILIAQTRMQQSKYKKQGVKSEFWPVVDIVGSYGMEENYQGVEGTKKDARIYSKLNWKYNLGNQTGAKLKNANRKYNSDKYTYQAAIKDIEQQVNQSWEKYQTQTSRNQLASETVEVAQYIYQSRSQLKQKGRGDEMGLLNAQVRLIDTQIAQLNAQHESIKASYELAYACGLFTASLFETN